VASGSSEVIAVELLLTAAKDSGRDPNRNRRDVVYSAATTCGET
jgi:hypothetical protein